MIPRYTVIVPVLRFRADEPVLASLRETAPIGGLQILVAEGRHPARQRNAALARATGAIVVFLDNDCTISPRFWTALDLDFARPEVEVVGGPALLRPQANGAEKIFHALLTHPFVVGPISARYAARGVFRATSQTELILCNLAARHAIFERTGPLSTQLYPNEENEWLDRAQRAGVHIFYDPDLQVYRPQRSSWIAMAVMLLRYGIGRTRQLQVSKWRPTAHQAAPLILLGPVLAVLLGPAYLVALGVLWLALALLVAATCGGTLYWPQRLLAGLVAPLIPLLYATGQVLGIATLFFPIPGSQGEIAVFDERGKPVALGREAATELPN